MIRLQRSWLRTALLWPLIWLATYAWLQRDWAFANRWLILSGAALGLILWAVQQRLILNHPPGESRLLPKLGPGNQTTLARGLLLGLLAGFLFSPWPMGRLGWFVAGLFTVASLADAFDGYVARRSDQVTQLGQVLDVEFDGMGVLIVSLLAIGYGQLPLWFLLVGLARYAFILALWWRERRGKPIFDMPPSRHRRILAGMLMGMMTVVLWPILPSEMAHVAAVVIGVPVLLGFLRDWLFASGRLRQTNAVYQRIRRAAYLLFARWLPPLLRILLLLSMAAMLGAATPWYQPHAWDTLLRSWGLPAASLLATLLALTGIAGAILAALGVLGRLAAILLLFPIGFAIETAGLTWQTGLALTCALLIAFFGTGLFSLWQPEEAFLVPRGGQLQEGDS